MEAEIYAISETRMMTPSEDRRSPERRALDEQIAAEAMLAPVELPPDAALLPIEELLLEGLQSGPAEEWTAQEWLELRQRVIRRWTASRPPRDPENGP
jgi:hypothetical protein